MSIKHQLQRSLYSILKHNKDGSFETQSARQKTLSKAATDLSAKNYKLRHINGLKQKHIVFLNQLWQSQNLSTATIKNRNAHLRWLCEKINKSNMVPTNDQLGLGKRKYASTQSKAIDLKEVDLSKITNDYVKIQIHLQRYLGLRREECIKLKPHLADKGQYLVLQPSWCKGGKGRIIPILSAEARYWLDEAKKIVRSDQSLIPKNKKYIQHRNLYDKQIQRAGIKHAHGLRHAYAQERYFQLTGWKCPKQCGPESKSLKGNLKKTDRLARLTISQELGHERIAITGIYL